MADTPPPAHIHVTTPIPLDTIRALARTLAYGAQAAACAHCWHTYTGGWAGSQPPPFHCCWCGLETCALTAVPQAHGPYGGDR